MRTTDLGVADAGRPVIPQPAVCGRIEGGGIESHGRTLDAIYEMEFTQLEAGETEMCVDFAASASSVIYRESYESRTQVLGSLRPGRFAFSVPIRESGTRWWGTTRADRLVPTAVSGEWIEARFAPGHAHFIAVVDHSALETALLESGFPDETVSSIRSGRPKRMMEVRDAVLRQLSGTLGRIADLAVSGTPGLSGSELDRLALDGALLLLDGREGPPIASGAASRLFRRAVEEYDRNGNFPNVMELSSLLHVRPRTLQDAFQHSVDMGPHRFFLLRRLNRARHHLAASHAEETSVKQVALGLGFTEFGRFAGRYRELFGECPSKTLFRRPRTVAAIPF